MTLANSIYQSLNKTHPGSLAPLTTLSKSDDGFSFIESDYSAFNFDTVQNLGGKETIKEKSPDALILKGDEIYFVEFKSGKWEKHDIRLKIHEGLTTLFQYATNNRLCTREEFLNIKFSYVVITTRHLTGKQKAAAAKSSMFLEALLRSNAYFGLSNLEGFLLKQASLFSDPQGIYKAFKHISSDAIENLVVNCPIAGKISYPLPVA